MTIMLKRQSKKHWMNADDILINVLLNIQAVPATLITAIDRFVFSDDLLMLRGRLKSSSLSVPTKTVLKPTAL